LQFQGDIGQSGRTPADNLSTWRVRGVFSVPLFTGGRIQAEVAEAQALLEEARAQLDDLQAQIEQDVLTSASAVASSREQARISEANLALARQELELARERFAQGVADNTEVVNAQDRIARAEDARIRALHSLNLAQANLLRSTGAAERTYRQ
jgi:outer membrane protein TolC